MSSHQHKCAASLDISKNWSGPDASKEYYAMHLKYCGNLLATYFEDLLHISGYRRTRRNYDLAVEVLENVDELLVFNNCKWAMSTGNP